MANGLKAVVVSLGLILNIQSVINARIVFLLLFFRGSGLKFIFFSANYDCSFVGSHEKDSVEVVFQGAETIGVGLIASGVSDIDSVSSNLDVLCRGSLNVAERTL